MKKNLSAFLGALLVLAAAGAAHAAGADEAEVWIYDEIGFSWFDEGITAAGFAKELAARQMPARLSILTVACPVWPVCPLAPVAWITCI